MGLVARNPEQAQKVQGSGEMMGSPPSYATGTVHHESIAEDGSTVSHSQRFEEGHLVEWTLGDEPAPWALIRRGTPTDACPTGRASLAEVEAVTVRIGEDHLVLPPLDDFADPSFYELDVVPDATARLRFELTGTPVGSVLGDIRYAEGRRPMSRVVQNWVEDPPSDEPACDGPLMSVSMTYVNYLRMRVGELTALEAIADGGDVGDTRWTLLLLLHGIVQTEKYISAYGSLPVFPQELGWWGEAAPFVAGDEAPR
jgi:hypothetical protein